MIWINFKHMSTRGLIKDITLSDLLDLELAMWTKAIPYIGVPAIPVKF